MIFGDDGPHGGISYGEPSVSSKLSEVLRRIEKMENEFPYLFRIASSAETLLKNFDANNTFDRFRLEESVKEWREKIYGF